MKEFIVKEGDIEQSTALHTLREAAVNCYPAYIGLDVHKETIVVSVARSGREGPESYGEIANKPGKVVKLMERLNGEFGGEVSKTIPVKLSCVKKSHVEKSMISIVVPVYNTSAYLGECIESILEQPVDSMEIIIVNGCSADCSAEFIEGSRKAKTYLIATMPEETHQHPTMTSVQLSAYRYAA